jgi:hypothetical protein
MPFSFLAFGLKNLGVPDQKKKYVSGSFICATV